MRIEDIARVAHSVNKVYCESTGDMSQVDWDVAPEHVKKSVMDGVQFLQDNPDAGPDSSHNNWLEFKKKEGGWKYAPVKNLEKKEHNCFLPYDQLPETQKVKDKYYITVVRALLPFLGHEPKTVVVEKPATEGGLNIDSALKAQGLENAQALAPQDSPGIVHSFDSDGKRHADLSGMVRKPV